MGRVIAFLPMRAGSERVKRKNTISFGNLGESLMTLKLKQLLACQSIDEIVVSTDDQVVIDYCSRLSSRRITLDIRPDSLAASSTSTDDLIAYVPTIITEGIVLWTHVTSPFITSELYDNAIKQFFNSQATHDSLMSVTRVSKFLFDGDQFLNFDRAVEKWPRTQTLPPIWEVNSGFFVAPVDVYKRARDRIGVAPALFPLSLIESMDVDCPEDFEVAELIYNFRAEKCLS